MVVFTIGPVQSFIAAARKTEDFWSGSYLLSHLVKEAMKSLYENVENFQMIYPNVTKEELFAEKLDENIHIASLPNRFTAILSCNEEETKAFLKSAENRVRESFEMMSEQAVERVFHPSIYETLKEKAKEQVNELVEIYWVAEKFNNEHEFNIVRERLEKRLGALKNERFFYGNEQKGLTCKICNERSALTYEEIEEGDSYRQMRQKLAQTWQHNVKRKVEFLCGVCLTKRFARQNFKKLYQVPDSFKRFEAIPELSGEDNYIAIIMMDGDNMGKWFSGEDIESFRKISRNLSNFAKKTVPTIVEEKFDGRLIYAGGDDVLAFVPVHQALKIAEALRFAFSDEEEGLGKGATASVGIIVGHQKAPLQQLLQSVRGLEKKAKSYHRRFTDEKKNALALSVHTRSGEISEAVLPWKVGEEKTTEMLHSLITLLQNDVSATFIHHFSQAFLPLISIRDYKYKVETKEMLEIELRRLLNRSIIEGRKGVKVDEHVHHLLNLHDASVSTMEFLFTLKMLTFLKKKEREEQAHEKDRDKTG